MDSLIQLETYTNELVAAVKSLTNYCRNAEISSSPSQLLVPPEAPSEVHRVRQTILTSMPKVATLLNEPADFLQHLASQNQLLACLQWLGEFQVLACIPLSGNIPVKDVADLSGVPETHLRHVVRMTATAGFLSEPQTGHVAHTTLSAPFVTKPLFLDAAMFLAESIAPAALQMAVASQRFGDSNRPHESAYNLAFNTSRTFESACEQRSKLKRQWLAYLRFGGDVEDSVTEVLSRFDWPSLGNACIVEVGAQSSRTAMSLAERYPALQFIVQLSEPLSVSSRRVGRTPSAKEMRQPELNSRITVHQRAPGTPQTVKDAAVYILPLPSPSPGVSSHSLTARLIAELRAHLGLLRANNSTALILTMCPLPEPGTVGPDIEASARQRDLALFQLANDRRIEMAEVEGLLNSVRDNRGRLVVVSKLRSWSNATVAMVVKYCHESQPTLSII